MIQPDSYSQWMLSNEMTGRWDKSGRIEALGDTWDRPLKTGVWNTDWATHTHTHTILDQLKFPLIPQLNITFLNNLISFKYYSS